MTGLKTLVQFLRSCDGGDGRSDAQGVKRSKLETQQNNHRFSGRIRMRLRVSGKVPTPIWMAIHKVPSNHKPSP
ncbi:unnamed protein product [Brassica oleracea]|uniref:(rape) hypothetical protein n=1 Tax=Brassica napus TaxID=3708 RepID=A0A816RU68_BRANA|nr:unnamed protein product [Brassica napus]